MVRMTFNKYQYWLTWNGESDRILFPVNPEEIQLKVGSRNESVDIAGLGETTVIQNRPAFSASFSSYFPANGEYGASPPSTYIKKIEKWKASTKPCHLIVTGSIINFFCTIENFTYSEKGGDVGTYYFSIDLKEFRPIRIRGISVV